MRTRVSKFAYGTFCDTWYRPEEHDHRVRVATLYTDFAGTKRIPDKFDIILPKVRIVRNIIMKRIGNGTDNYPVWPRIPKSPRRKSSKTDFPNTSTSLTNLWTSINPKCGATGVLFLNRSGKMSTEASIFRPLFKSLLSEAFFVFQIIIQSYAQSISGSQMSP